MSDVNSPEFWQAIYRDGRAGWDLGEPTPVFRRILQSGRLPPGRMIVLGAGRGHDARMFARHGFDVTAVDFAEDAVRAMQDMAEPEAPLTIMQADIFDLPEHFGNEFDYVLEYTCFCAIDPQRRAAYADVVAHLLKPGGMFVALLFPTCEGEGGPPFAVSPHEVIQLFRERGFKVIHLEVPHDSVPQRQGIEELVIFRNVRG